MINIYSIISMVQHVLKVNFNEQPIGNSNFEHPRNKTETNFGLKSLKNLNQYFFETKNRWYLQNGTKLEETKQISYNQLKMSSV